MKTAIVTDTNSGISPRQARELGIYLIPMPFVINGQTYLEGEDCTPDFFFREQRTGAEIFTSQPAPSEITSLWSRLLAEYDAILHFPMSSGISGSCQTAKALAQDYDGRVLVVDDGRISVTLMQSVCNAKALLARGMAPDRVREVLEERRDQAKVYLAVNTLEYLRKSGRVTAAGAAMASVLHIKPVLQLQGGKLDAYKKVRGMNQGKKVLLEALKRDVEEQAARQEVVIFSGYSGADPSLGERWQKEVQAAFPDREVALISLPLSICCHTGEDALGVAWAWAAEH